VLFSFYYYQAISAEFIPLQIFFPALLPSGTKGTTTMPFACVLVDLVTRS